MEASRHNRSSSPAPAGGRLAAAGGATLSDLGRLIERADALHLRAPELALVLGERAAALAESAGADEQWIRAESLVVAARVRLGGRTSTVGRAVAALRAAEHAGYTDTAARLRIDLAVCARSLGTPLTGLAALRPVLSEPAVSATHRAEALCHLVGCLAQFGRKPELDRVLVEADKLVVADESLDADTRLLVRALLRNGAAAHRRRHGDLTAAADAARTGLGFLEKLDNPADDGGLVRVRLVLQLVSTLLDRGDADMAYDIAEPMLNEPVRAAGVAPTAWLRLAVATRVHLPAGAGDAAAELVREAVASTDRHGLSAITARLWLELAQIEERFGSAEEAIACLHRSRAAEHVHSRARRQACGLLAGEFGADTVAPLDLDDVIARSAPQGGRPVPMAVEPPVRDVETTALIRAISAEPPAPKAPAAPAAATPAAKPDRQPAAAKPAVAKAPRTEDRPRPETPPRPAPPAETAYVRAAGSVPERPARTVEKPGSSAPTWSFGRAEAESEAERTSVIPVIRDEPAPAAPERVEPPAEQVARFTLSAPSAETPDRPRVAEPTAPVAPAAPPAQVKRPVNGSHSQARTGRRAAPEPALPGWVKPFKKPAAPKPEPVAEVQREEPPAREAPRAEELPRLALPDLSDILPELPMAPAPADEPAAPLWESDEWAREERARRDETARGRKTRHDAEHGSVAARSVLDRLGISAGGGGGRRRADDASAREDAVQEETTRTEEPEPVSDLSDVTDPPWKRETPDLAPAPRAETVSEEAVDPWLPRLRMPPALDPLEDFDSWTPTSQPFPESYARAIAEDEPPPDAGLAELLARALAEHQAGTASAAALVKRLGSEDDPPRRPVNGHASADRKRNGD
ncbi:hypothetical protein VSH64_23800 [Amycolatopsis rhabdoformis]|uniref:Tetratricopeptide repeat protein n=1 Tax=Amycolatopsis rhabdoformis TaxID=1448059 RepID=A0ABZ1HX21_9PSEU|nr:hypothetical protein [Amycolatopsis rhabdoformis]WSE25915.1 hypothetical protein VSH64_23800 [Amycolatopsis rhabdoformis]